MRRFSLLLISFIVVFATEKTWSQTEKSTAIFFDSGLSFPSKPKSFSDYWKMGFNFGVGISFPLSGSISLIGSIDYNTFSFDEDNFLKSNGFTGTGLSVTGSSASIFTIMGNVKVLLNSTPNTASPYITGGLGLFSVSTSDATLAYQGQTVTVDGDSESAFSLLIGAGIEIPAGTSIFFIEGKYSIGFTKNESTSYIPIKIGIRLNIWITVKKYHTQIFCFGFRFSEVQFFTYYA